MDSCLTLQPPAEATQKDAVVSSYQDHTALVDPFLVEALQNPRHRLTILRMELDIKKFLQNTYQQQFEFQHFPTSYLRLAAHRVAQHYGLQTIVQDNFVDGQGTRIVVRKVAESRFPVVCLSDIQAKHLDNEKQGQMKIVLRPRPDKASFNGSSELGVKQNPVKSVEERKEEYDKARARIFNGPSSSCLVFEDSLSKPPSDGKNMYLSGDESDGSGNYIIESEKIFSSRDVGTSRVAIFRDREKDRSDPDYDRSYEKYVRNSTTTQQPFCVLPFCMQNFRHPGVQFDSVAPHLGQMLRPEGSFTYQSNVMNPLPAFGLNQQSRDAFYMQWPSQAMMYTQSYDQLRNTVFQAPFCQQPLSLDYSQNHF